MKQYFAEPFRDRTDAGRILADHLITYRDHPKLLVLGLPRGGVPVAVEVARELEATVDIFLVRKLSVPNQPELVMGAIASGGIEVFHSEVLRRQKVSAAMIEAVVEHERPELRRRERMYRGLRPMAEVFEHTVILIDDGLTTGNTMLTAVAALRNAGPRRIVVATPVGSQHTCNVLRQEADEVVCAHIPEPLYSVDRWYRDYSPVMDRDIREMLDQVEMQTLAPLIH
jgi:putative phosphoribosyl transferase